MKPTSELYENVCAAAVWRRPTYQMKVWRNALRRAEYLSSLVDAIAAPAGLPRETAMELFQWAVSITKDGGRNAIDCGRRDPDTVNDLLMRRRLEQARDNWPAATRQDHRDNGNPLEYPRADLAVIRASDRLWRDRRTATGIINYAAASLGPDPGEFRVGRPWRKRLENLARHAHEQGNRPNDVDLILALACAPPAEPEQQPGQYLLRHDLIIPRPEAVASVRDLVRPAIADIPESAQPKHYYYAALTALTGQIAWQNLADENWRVFANESAPPPRTQWATGEQPPTPRIKPPGGRQVQRLPRRGP